ncbi:MAG TPA: hypothetical protein VFH88_00035 [Candidatus Krumholzibacteria bacterium]|nr:hypothetical protein [Candidatus Krumholzibacteria bacterium]
MASIHCDRPAVSLGVLALFLLAGCSSGDPAQSVGPASPAAMLSHTTGPQRYPLEIGNRWSYAGELTITAQDGAPDDIDFHESSTEVDEVVGTEQILGTEYLVTRQTINEESRQEPLILWVRSRQDRTGLYEADVPLNDPPQGAVASNAGRARSDAVFAGARVSGQAAFAQLSPPYRAALATVEAKRRYAEMAIGRVHTMQRDASAGEIVRLDYPLHTGAAWNIRTEPFNVHACVEGRDVLDLPVGKTPAWRVRITLEFLGENDVVLMWYGDEGYLGYYLHVIGIATDPEGTPIGAFVDEETQQLTAVALNTR